ncbi:hypothetical protein Goklo_016680 [Gossypium klotzschianum]|uniref:Uncharacterized protein n=1 Tax=Gossypium klotzschianum TaxID=34286 RepID=A0A7J8UF07_9ROSI|nr:hypothetical protein [Gossypium klotzschianum]
MATPLIFQASRLPLQLKMPLLMLYVRLSIIVMRLLLVFFRQEGQLQITSTVTFLASYHRMMFISQVGVIKQ